MALAASRTPLEINPPCVEFADIAPGRTYEAAVSLRNISSHLAAVRVRLPNSKVFKLQGGEKNVSIAPGLETHVAVRFQCGKDKSAASKDDSSGARKAHTGYLEVQSGSDIYKVKILAEWPKAHWDVTRHINFGRQISDGRVSTKTLTIRNDGSKAGTFSIQCGLEALAFEPSSDTVAPFSSVDVKVELACNISGKLEAYPLVKLSDGVADPVTLEAFVSAELTRTYCDVVDENGKPLSALTLGPTYFGTVRKATVFLRNIAPNHLDFVVQMVERQGNDWSQALCVTAALAAQKAKQETLMLESEHGDMAGRILQVTPSCGQVQPYGSTPLTIIFSPVFQHSELGWKQNCMAPAPRIFPCHVLIKSATAAFGGSAGAAMSANIGITGHAVAVQVNIEPTGSMGDSFQRRATHDALDSHNVYDFGTCRVDSKVEVTFRVLNYSDRMSVCVKARRLAHFSCAPSRFTVPVGGCVEVLVTFLPRQLGLFNSSLGFEVLDVAGPQSKHVAARPVIYEIFSHLRGMAVADGKKTIKPFVGTQTGKWNPSVSLIDSYGTALESTAARFDQSLTLADPKKRTAAARVAHPNETRLARSIRPHPATDPVRFPYTGTARHTYTDTDYGHMELEAAVRRDIKRHYNKKMESDSSRKKKETKRREEFKRHNNPTDINLVPSRDMAVADPANMKANTIINAGYRQPLTVRAPSPQLDLTKLITTHHTAALALVIPEEAPGTKEEQRDCARTLSIKERSLFTVSNKALDLGRVDAQSEVTRELTLTNSNSHAVLFSATGSAAELQSCLPWQAVVPAMSSCVFRITFKAPNIPNQRVYRDVQYSLNGVAEHWITVKAQVVPVELLLEPTELELAPTAGMSDAGGVSGVVRLMNPGNAAVPFSWEVDTKPAQDHFWTVEPEEGVIQSGSMLYCKVTCWSAVDNVSSVRFALNANGAVQGGLSCSAKFTKAECAFLERRVQFGVVPYNLLSVQPCTLVNKSDHHTFFRVVVSGSTEKDTGEDGSPAITAGLNLSVTPECGFLPAGGQLQLQAVISPGTTGRQETSFNVAFRNGSRLTLKVWATVEAPKVRLDNDRWIFGNVYMGSMAFLPFRLSNDGSCRALVSFDLSKHPELAIKIRDRELLRESATVKSFQFSNRYTLEVPARTSIKCVVQLVPKNILVYSYDVVVEVNKLSSLPAALRKEARTSPPEKAGAQRSRLDAKTEANLFGYRLPLCTVQATVMCSPLKVKVDGTLVARSKDQDQLPHGFTKVEIQNQSAEAIQYAVNPADDDCEWPVVNRHIFFDKDVENLGESFHRACSNIIWTSLPNEVSSYYLMFVPMFEEFEGPTYQCLLKPASYDCHIHFTRVLSTRELAEDPGSKFIASIPVTTRIDAPSVTFACNEARLMPVPLGARTSTKFSVTMDNFEKLTKLKVVLPVEIGDLAEMYVLQLVADSTGSGVEDNDTPIAKRVNYLTVPARQRQEYTLLLSFMSKTPMSFSTKLILHCEDPDYEFSVPVYATADNSLLTLHTFLTEHAGHYDIYRPNPDEVKSSGEASEEDGALDTDEAFEDDKSRLESLPNTGSSITLKLRDDYGYSIDDAATLTMVMSSAGNAVFTRTPTPSVAVGEGGGDDKHGEPLEFTIGSSVEIGGSWSVYSYQSQTTATQGRTSADGEASGGRLSQAAAPSIVSSTLGSVPDETPFDTDPRRLFQELLGLNPFENYQDAKISSQQMIVGLERWLQLHGWPDGRRHMSIPHDFRRGFHFVPEPPSPKVGPPNVKKPTVPSPVRRPCLDDVLCHLVRHRIPGVPMDRSLVPDVLERALQIQMHYHEILKFMSSRGCLVSNIQPEDLLDFEEYAALKFHEKHKESPEARLERDIPGFVSQPFIPTAFHGRVAELVRLKYNYELASRQAWITLLLQLIKVFVLRRITRAAVKASGNPAEDISETALPLNNDAILCSNVYSRAECNLLAWVNHIFAKYSWTVKSTQLSCRNSTIKPREVNGFGEEFSDGLVFAVLLLAYVPFLEDDILSQLYLQPTSKEECMHNTISVVSAFQALCLDDYLEPQDIVETNPVVMLLFVMDLFHKLPKYLPAPNSVRNTVLLEGTRNKVPVRSEVRLKNPSSRPATYVLKLIGEFASRFHLLLPSGSSVSVPARGMVSVGVEYCGRFLHESQCTLIAVTNTIGIKQQVHTFVLKGSMKTLKTHQSKHCSATCYEPQLLKIPVFSPFDVDDTFAVTVVEKSVRFPKLANAETVQNMLMDTSSSLANLAAERAWKSSGEDTDSSDADTVLLPFVFFAKKKQIYLVAGQASSLPLEIIALQPVSRSCSVILSSKRHGDLIIDVTADVKMPKPVSGSALEELASLLRPPRRIMPSGEHPQAALRADNTIFIHCASHEDLVSEQLAVSSCNAARDHAVALRQDWQLSDLEVEQRADFLATRIPGCDDNFYFTQIADLEDNQLEFTVSSNNPALNLPRSFAMPFWENTALAGKDSASQQVPDISFGRPAPGKALLDWVYTSNGVPGRYPLQIILWHLDDVRVVQLEIGVSLPPMMMGNQISVRAATSSSVVHDLPLTNNDRNDWPLVATVEGRGFSGSQVFVAKAMSDSFYPLTFHPHYLGTVEGMLTLVNKEDGVERCFNLRGEGTTPHPLKTINLKCQVGKRANFDVHIPNETDFDLNMTVYKGSEWLTGPDTIFVEAHSVLTVPMTCTTNKHGSSSCQVKFEATPSTTEGRKSTIGRIEYQNYLDSFNKSDNAGNYLHIVQLNIKSIMKALSSVVKVLAPVGSKVECMLKLTGGKKDLSYDVKFYGDPCLSGPTEVLVPRGKDLAYEAVFAPTRLTGTTKSNIVFVPRDAVAREVRYAIEATVTNARTVQLPRMEVSLGRSCASPLTLTNPLSEEIRLTPLVSNPRNFSLDVSKLIGVTVTDDGDIILEPNQSVDIPIVFFPTRVEGLMSTTMISFTCTQLGALQYNVTGKPLAAGSVETTVVRCPVFGSVRHKVVFNMPLEHEAVLSLNLVEEPLANMSSIQQASCLIARFNPNSLRSGSDIELLFGESVVMQPGTTLHIPVMFSPQSMATRYGHLQITLRPRGGSGKQPNATWTYPFTFLPVFSLPRPSPPLAMLAKVGERSEQNFTVQIPVDLVNDCLQPPGAVDDSSARRTVSTDSLWSSLRSLAKRQEEFEQASEMLRGCCAAVLRNQASVGEHGGVQLSHDVIFLPSYEGWFDVALTVTHKDLGEWQQPLTLHASSGEYDGVVHLDLESLNQELSVVLDVCNKRSCPAECRAFFTTGSHQGFSVRPKEAILPPKGTKEGCMFEITYSPKIYRFPLDGFLIIKTTADQWIFKIEAKAAAPDADGQTSYYTARNESPMPSTQNFVRFNRQQLKKGV
eukprot:scpid2123/ scgid22385/ Uncharacterized protein CXorf22